MSQKRKDAKYLHENPHVEATAEERAAAAMEYYYDKRYGWDKPTICYKAGISISTFHKALRHKNDPNEPAVTGRGKGRLLSETAFVKLQDLVTYHSLRLDAPESTEPFVAFIKQVLREEKENDLLDWDFGSSWLRKLK
ncbi:hypothetical protein B484DRAFT_395226 [Ochromonadaceae sp. CCMP2298]|nr:hypothetical protein B484DRAFT_395226 [Ochromonadaceae sp. CCMP2298]